MSERISVGWCLGTALWIACASPGAAEPFKDIAPLAATCNNCHGVDGISAGGSMASLAGQSEEYLRTIMSEWRSGERFSTTMGRLLAGYSEEQINALAAYYAAKSWVPAEQELDARLVRQGGFAAERCARCHGQTGAEPKTEETPRLDGQWARHLELEILKYRDPQLEFPHEKMQENVHRLRARDVAAVAHFFASQTAGPPRAPAE